mmetsp:Transcript_36265/g.49150  ORF Transcript_36265/g.49150 Transcript_36265/m.49150 type:complete len:111 (+) Transcript_36265:508-840(+)
MDSSGMENWASPCGRISAGQMASGRAALSAERRIDCAGELCQVPPGSCASEARAADVGQPGWLAGEAEARLPRSDLSWFIEKAPPPVDIRGCRCMLPSRPAAWKEGLGLR